MQISGQIGPAGPVASGSPTIPVRQGNYAEPITSALNARYYEQGIRGNVFTIANTAIQALSLASTTTYTGLILGNPTGSGKNFVLLEAIFAASIVPAGVGAVILAYTTYNVPTTLVIASPTLIGSGATSASKVGTANTALAGTPVYLRPMIGVGLTASPSSVASFQYKDDIGGLIIIPPGQQLVIAAVTTAITGIASYTWAELSSTVL
jgi:hypothetical protein